ncbi:MULTISPECIES: PDR/VanB family oxidoreductase [unclassified Streptomyces]|uniref:PDR/VanB family oxidoreductase n=1 Tax=unclassified Streptomyces TaxID=2593676 RepID=UPI00224D93E3|nr:MULTISPECIES: PDR/VanB family oxidoreductase [unclassified Streptomyces]MCX4641986.1 PDR/VanB family oxidoreductase [Streptomyces sp. NBC_01446]MCX5085718.1 PDR/VanB family oxidoreductase [Streptomyces sp. NBC_00401]MCX5326859.1 PDR/VanB family oxidoreductase [Streptomyces sp. NBC_00120]
MTLTVTNKQQLAEGVVSVTLARPDGGRLPDWTPGSHIDLVLPDGTVRQYSLCGDRWDAHTYRIAVLREPAGRGGSAYVHDRLRAGDRVGVGGPRNHFPLAPSESYVFIAGGIGITPLLPMVRQAELLGADWQLLYGGRSRASMAFRDELVAAYGERVHVVPQDELGLLDLNACLGTPRADTKVYCCGPAPLLAAVEDACASWAPYALRTERFTAGDQAAPVRDGAFEVELRRSGRAVTVTPGISVLEAVRVAGVDVLSSCEQGTCGTCLTPVLDGQPDHRDSILTDHQRAANDCMFVCVSRSCGDRLVLDL